MRVSRVPQTPVTSYGQDESSVFIKTTGSVFIKTTDEAQEGLPQGREPVLDLPFTEAKNSSNNSTMEPGENPCLVLKDDDVELLVKFKNPQKDESEVIWMDYYENHITIIKKYKGNEYSVVLFDEDNPSPTFAYDLETGVEGISVKTLIYHEEDPVDNQNNISFPKDDTSKQPQKSSPAKKKPKVELLVLVLDNSKRVTVQFVITSLFKVKSLLVATEAFDNRPFLRVNRQMKKHFELIFRVSSHKIIYHRWEKIAATQDQAWTNHLRQNHCTYALASKTEAVSRELLDFNFGLRMSQDQSPFTYLGFLSQQTDWFSFTLALVSKGEDGKLQIEKKKEHNFSDTAVRYFSLVFRQPPEYNEIESMAVNLVGLKTSKILLKDSREKVYLKLIANVTNLGSMATSEAQITLKHMTSDLNNRLADFPKEQNQDELISKFVQDINCSVAVHLYEKDPQTNEKNTQEQGQPIVKEAGDGLLGDSIFTESLTVAVGIEQALYRVAMHEGNLVIVMIDFKNEIDKDLDAAQSQADHKKKVSFSSIAPKEWRITVRDRLEMITKKLNVQAMMSNGTLCLCNFRGLLSQTQALELKNNKERNSTLNEKSKDEKSVVTGATGSFS